MADAQTESGPTVAEVAGKAVRDYLAGFYCMGEPVPEVSSLVDVIEVALFERPSRPGETG